MTRLFIGGYYLSWMAASALLVHVPLAVAWGAAGLSHRLGIDDGVTALGLPLGAALGAWAAARTRSARKLRLVFLMLGPLLLLAGAWLACSSLAASERAKGLGPFSGLGELVVAAMAIVLGVFGVFVFGIWMFGSLAKFPEVEQRPRRSASDIDR